jgi:hypothetical protein
LRAVHRHQLVAGRVEDPLELLDGVEQLAGLGLLDPVGDAGGGGVVGRAVGGLGYGRRREACGNRQGQQRGRKDRSHLVTVSRGPCLS